MSSFCGAGKMQDVLQTSLHIPGFAVKLTNPHTADRAPKQCEKGSNLAVFLFKLLYGNDCHSTRE